ncbi:hypothetical protein [Butyrivibrio proteoclasticus]|uniref:hypothetical protein n=1 Tax=Butyrivibrio proteoclasticus TaxID=43305 RepID=UPI00047EE66D|nr:hypothetical protein [Butyrivibrio proteoclasticus]
METKIKEIREYMEGAQAETKAKIDALVADDRADEARAYRAALNIYDVFTALILASAKEANGDEAIMVEKFKKLSTNIPAQWRASLAKAKEHDDAEKIMIEEAKLSVADAIIAKFNELF